VITDRDKEKAERLAGELGREFFKLRQATQPPYTTLEEAMVRVRSHTLPRPLVLADVSDNAGGGAASDSTFLLDAMIKQRVKDVAIGMFWDPMVVRLAFEAGEGARLDVRLGGSSALPPAPRSICGLPSLGSGVMPMFDSANAIRASIQ